MSFRDAIAAAIVLVTAYGEVNALTVSSPSKAISLPQGAEAVDVTLQVGNSSPNSVSIAVWQLGISVVAGPGATGACSIESIAAPPGYLFEGTTPSGPNLVPPTVFPTTSGIFSDISILANNGVAIAPAELRNLLRFRLQFTSDARGVFEVVLFPFDANPFAGSFWSDPSMIALTPFENLTATASVAERTVAQIAVGIVPEPLTATQLCIGLFALMPSLRLRSQERS